VGTARQALQLHLSNLSPQREVVHLAMAEKAPAPLHTMTSIGSLDDGGVLRSLGLLKPTELGAVTVSESLSGLTYITPLRTKT